MTENESYPGRTRKSDFIGILLTVTEVWPRPGPGTDYSRSGPEVCRWSEADLEYDVTDLDPSHVLGSRPVTEITGGDCRRSHVMMDSPDRAPRDMVT